MELSLLLFAVSQQCKQRHVYGLYPHTPLRGRILTFDVIVFVWSECISAPLPALPGSCKENQMETRGEEAGGPQILRSSITMCEQNQTTVTEFILLGFQSFSNLKALLFSLVFSVYVIILCGNLLIIVLVSTNHRLQVPMFYFLKNLALVDILFTTNIVPNMLYIILMEGGKISTTGCFVQYYVHCICIYTQSVILSVMSLDRYMAICQPLHYFTVMNPKVCFHLAFWSWAAGFFLIPSEFLLIFQLQFCESAIIDHFFCDFAPFLRLSSSNTEIIRWQDFMISVLLIFLPFLFVIVSYVCIFITILKISTAAGRKKAFSTCSSHLATVSTHYGALVTIYIFTARGNSLPENKWRSLLYTVLTPFINPILYSMRNQEFRKVLKKLICRR
ncbi:olfactory receptor 11A1-like [Engystomops pustulosus]|uniref:olfactory receptor 11A1-like n=1 Tax=Engystomops pustulosus TaxID=76066 RepID=UPI003AFAD9D4